MNLNGTPGPELGPEVVPAASDLVPSIGAGPGWHHNGAELRTPAALNVAARMLRSITVTPELTLGTRIVIYSQDSLGLGHLRRTTLIAEEILAARPHASVLLITDSPLGPFFRLHAHMDHLKLPSMRKVDAGVWESTRLNISASELRCWRSDLLRNTLLNYLPDLVLVDHMPGGAQGELLPGLEALRSAKPDCRLVIGLRDILDAEDVIRRVWNDEGAYTAVHRLYDRVLIYGDRSIFDTAAIYGIPIPRFGVQYCGYVVNHDVPQPSAVSRFMPRRGQKLVYVSAGGGGDSACMMRTFLQAVRLLGHRADFATLLAVGVNAPSEVTIEMARLARDLPVRVVTHVANGFNAVAAADLVVCMAGYNTIAEVLRLRKKTLVIPRNGPSHEQRMRAELLERRGLVDLIDPRDLTPEILGERLLTDLTRTDLPRADSGFIMDGARVAAASLVQLLGVTKYARNA